jgi:hypothetical protein
MVGNTNSTLTGTGFLPDYEFDQITNGCQTTMGAGMAMLAGTTTGTAINGNTASVVFLVVTPDKGNLTAGVNTTSGMAPGDIAKQAVANANGALTAVGSTVRCSTDPNFPASASCASGGAKVGAASTVTASVPVSFQLNDVGLRRFVTSGPVSTLQTIQNNIVRDQGIVNMATVSKPPVAPAVSGWAAAGLFALLGATGLLFARRRLVSRTTAS